LCGLRRKGPLFTHLSQRFYRPPSFPSRTVNRGQLRRRFFPCALSAYDDSDRIASRGDRPSHPIRLGDCPASDWKWRKRSAVKITERTHEDARRTTTRRVAILRRHLREKERVSDLCEELGLRSTVFCRWQKEFFENGAAAFRHRGRANHQVKHERIAHLEKKIQMKDEVLAELMADAFHAGALI
jgi:transposase